MLREFLSFIRDCVCFLYFLRYGVLGYVLFGCVLFTVPVWAESEDFQQKVLLLQIQKHQEARFKACTGFFVRDREGEVLLVTAFHCLVDTGSLEALFGGYRSEDLRAVHLDGIYDLAILRVRGLELLPGMLVLGESFSDSGTQRVHIPGYPNGRFQSVQGDFFGVGDYGMYQVALSGMNLGGLSGGPVISSVSREVIGVLFRGNNSLHFFTPIGRVHALIEGGEELKCFLLELCIRVEIDRMTREALEGDVAAQYQLGYLYFMGIGLEEDKDEAVFWLRHAAGQGHTDAQYHLGYAYELLGDYELSFFWYEKAAEQDHASAQNNLGYFYENGLGREKDLERSLFWYMRAARLGHAGSQYNVGKMYDYGLGVEENDRAAFIWYKRSALRNFSWAQRYVGRIYDRGIVVKEDAREAFIWYEKAARQGDAESQYYLSLLYEKGRGVLRDEEKALWWLKRSAQQGFLKAVIRLK